VKIIDKNQWKRKSHFEFFSGMDYPHFNVCFEVDVTATRNYAKKYGVSFFSLVLYFTSFATNRIPEMRIRIRDAQVVEHECVHPSFTIINDNNTFNYCSARFGYDSQRFFQEVHENMKEAKLAKHLLIGDSEQDDFIYITSLPWISFTSLQHPVHFNKNDSIPRLSWGRFCQRGDQWWMPYSLQMHHGLADGYHAGLFCDFLKEMLNRPESYITF
jgi:chloramphenicol O-acetyltransferase type A